MTRTYISGGHEYDRFWAYVNRDVLEDQCWEWTGALSDGYGYFKRAVGLEPRMVKAHRYAYTYLLGEIPEGLVLDHLCRNRKCVNPLHLEPVTNEENILRGESGPARNARKTHCPQGHPYDELNTYTHTSGWRQCKTCRNEAVRKYNQKPENKAARQARMNSGVGKGGYQKSRTHCPKGHEYTEANTMIEKAKKPDGSIQEKRRCRACRAPKRGEGRKMT